MISYNDIYEAVRKERVEELQPLPANFLDDVASYFKEKKEFSSKNSDDFSENSVKTKKQLENARTLVKELILRRRKKIMNLLLIATETGISKRDFENMLDFEKKMFDGLMKSLDSTENRISDLINGKKKSGEKHFVVFREDVEEFVGMEGELLGPFKQGDKIELQNEIVKILVEGGKADLVV